MTAAIFLLQDNHSLVEMREQPYDSEDLLQRLLADYPSLLAGEQVNTSSPRRWLLVKREAGVPSKASGGSQWAIDNLFLDQDGIPTIVEVKRSSDTRIRREVVGQMLDYAANAVAYWPASSLRSMFEEFCRSKGAEPESVLTEFLNRATDQSGSSVDSFWDSVERNLQSHRIRMLFVADLVPPELQRIVEFLNEQMSPAEVLAVEIRQYVGLDAKTLVPRVIGQTAQAQANKAGGASALPWDRERFLSVLVQRADTETARIAARIMDALGDGGWQLMWGKGTIDGSCQPVFRYKSGNIWPMFLWSHGKVQVQFGHLATTPPFTDLAKRLEFRRRLLEILGVQLPEEADKYPTFFMAPLKAVGAVESLIGTFNWVASEMKAYQDSNQLLMPRLARPNPESSSDSNGHRQPRTRAAKRGHLLPRTSRVWTVMDAGNQTSTTFKTVAVRRRRAGRVRLPRTPAKLSRTGPGCAPGLPPAPASPVPAGPEAGPAFPGAWPAHFVTRPSVSASSTTVARAS